MKRYALIFLVGLFFAPLVVSGQSCSNLPCGPIPWPLPGMPVLVSPSPMPTIGITAVPTSSGAPTATPAPTDTPAPTGTVISDFTSLSDNMATLQGMLLATSEPVEINGTAIDPNEQLATSVAGSTTFFSYVRAFSGVDVGFLGQIINFALVSFATVIAVKLATFILPVLGTLFGIILGAVQFFISFFKV